MKKLFQNILIFALFFLVFNTILYLVNHTTLNEIFTNPFKGSLVFFYLPALAATISLQKNLKIAVLSTVGILVVITLINFSFINSTSEASGLNAITLFLFGLVYGIAGSLIGAVIKVIYQKFQISKKSL